LRLKKNKIQDHLNNLINRIAILKAKFKYFLLINLLIDFLIKFKEVAFWKSKLKNIKLIFKYVQDFKQKRYSSFQGDISYICYVISL